MYYKGCGLLCAHKKSFNTAIPVRSLGPYMYVHYYTCIVHILVWTYLFLLASFFDCLSFCGLFLKHPYKRFFPFYILYFYLSRSLCLSLTLSVYLSLSLPLSLSVSLSLSMPLSVSPSLSLTIFYSLTLCLTLTLSVYVSLCLSLSQSFSQELHPFIHSWFVRTLRTKKPKTHFYFRKIKYEVTIHIQSCAISIRQSRIFFFFPIENFKMSVQFKLIYFIQIKRWFPAIFFIKLYKQFTLRTDI